jgi:hypothetical protein
MNATVKKFLRTSALSPVDTEDVLAVLRRRIRDLEARRTVITEQIINLETTTSPAYIVSADLAQAEAVLDGEPFVASREKPLSQLAALHAERDIIDRALKIGRSREHQLATERATEIWVAHFAEIAEIEKRRVMLALELQRINRAREVLREKINKAGGAGYLSTDSAELLGWGDVHDPVMWSAERLIADGIVTRAEIEKARSDG